MAGATAEKAPKTSDRSSSVVVVAEALGDREMRLDELIKATGERSVTLAWTGGYIEIGHREFSVTGNPNNAVTQNASELHIEHTTNWSGEKTRNHCSLRELIARGAVLPQCGSYKRNRAADEDYLPEPDKSPLTKILRDDAEKLVFLKAKLTDKGHQLLIEE